jgi:hypothetical protein
MTSKLRAQLIKQIAENVAAKMKLKIEPGKINIMSSVPGGRQLGYIDWGGIITNVIGTAAQTYSSKELQKTQAALASKLAEAEAKKMLALTELELAKANTQAQQTALLQKQNELQLILKDIQFTNVQKWLLGGAGFLAFAFGAFKLYQAATVKKRTR